MMQIDHLFTVRMRQLLIATGNQQFFLDWTKVWRRKYSEANLRQRRFSSIEQLTCFARNLDKWHDAFQPKKDKKLYHAPKPRARIW